MRRGSRENDRVSTVSALQSPAAESRYYDVYARSLRDPAGFWAEAAEAIDWFDQPKGLRSRSRRLWPLVRGRDLQHLFQCRRSPCGARTWPQNAIIYDCRSPGSAALSPMRSCSRRCARCRRVAGFRRRRRRPCYPLYADGAGSADRDAGLRPHRGDPLRGVRRLCGSRTCDPLDDAKPKVISRPACGIEPGRIVHYKPLLDQAIALAPRSRKPA